MHGIKMSLEVFLESRGLCRLLVVQSVSFSSFSLCLFYLAPTPQCSDEYRVRLVL